VRASTAPAAALLVAVQLREYVAPLADSPSLYEVLDPLLPKGRVVALELVVSGHTQTVATPHEVSRSYGSEGRTLTCASLGDSAGGYRVGQAFEPRAASTIRFDARSRRSLAHFTLFEPELRVLFLIADERAIRERAWQASTAVVSAECRTRRS
jgi:hypothetical protein